jgi:hypothetical protein
MVTAGFRSEPRRDLASISGEVSRVAEEIGKAVRDGRDHADGGACTAGHR